MGPREPVVSRTSLCGRKNDLGEGFEYGEPPKEVVAHETGLDEAGQDILGEDEQSRQRVVLVLICQGTDALGGVRVEERRVVFRG